MQSAPSGTVTFLLTDIEGSTRRRQDEPEVMRALLVEHDSILRDVIDKHNGLLFRHTDDGVAAVFASAGDAAAAAVDAQQRLQDVLSVRMGLHTGEAELRDGDYLGSTVNRCARLTSIGHGGQVVCSESTASLVRERDDLRDLGEHLQRDLSRVERVWQVGGGEFAALRSLANYPTNLPLQSSSFVGRADEVEAIEALLGEHRLVTLTGVGGVGKTRLALEVGAEVLPGFVDGVWLVDLAPLAHDAMVLATIADVLGVAAQTGEPLATTLVSRLRAKQLLVIIDNCEHVLGPVARFVDRLAASAPGVRVLATSRERLGIAVERVQAVPPLAEGTAVELFIGRATQAGAVLDKSQRRSIGEICVRLDGLPLAIELAAARARMMTPSQIAERLDQRFRLLTGGGRTAVARHRTLQATVSWSYELLDSTERALFQRLSTLAGSFDLDAAEAIGADGIVEGFEVLNALGHLVDKSMVLAVPAPAGVRYRLLETLRQFAADRLAEQPDATLVQDRHAAYWRDRAVTLGEALRASNQAAVLFDAIEVDIDNYRSAFAYLLTAGRVNDAAAGVLALDMFWGLRRTGEWRRWYRELFEHPDLDGDLRLQALAAAARFEAINGDLHAGERYGTEAVRLAQAAGVDPPWQAPLALMAVASHRNDPAAFRQWWLQARRIAMASGTRYGQLFIESQRGQLPDAWDSAELIEHYERLIPEGHRLGIPTLGEMQFASVLYYAGQRERARELAHSVIEPAQGIGGSVRTGALFASAAYDTLGGDTVRARANAAQGLRIAHDEGRTRHLLYFVYVAAALAAQCNDIETTAVLLTAAARYANPFGLGVTGIEFTCRLEAQAAVDAHPGDFSVAQQRGESMTIEDLTTYTLDSLTAASAGAVPHVDRAAAELVVCGPTPRRRDTGLPLLTPREEAVARLVAEGLTNREIAERLFVSVKTVEYHLANAFMKLGVRRRAHLAAHVASMTLGDQN
ncbi:MAG: LuxR C-terminal-related transcriptional regulator [Acidimicrobiales bacterium]